MKNIKKRLCSVLAGHCDESLQLRSAVGGIPQHSGWDQFSLHTVSPCHKTHSAERVVPSLIRFLWQQPELDVSTKWLKEWFLRGAWSPWVVTVTFYWETFIFKATFGFWVGRALELPCSLVRKQILFLRPLLRLFKGSLCSLLSAYPTWLKRI